MGGEITPTQALAARVRELREARGLSQRVLGERMVHLGYRWGDTIVSRVERSERDVTTAELMGLSLALGAPPTAFLTVDTPIAIGDYPLSVVMVNDWIRGRYALGLNPDGSGLTKIVSVGQALETSAATPITRRRGAE